MESLAESAGENFAVDEFNTYIGDYIGQKDPYRLKSPQGLSKRDAAVLKRCRRRAHQLDHNAVLCYCCPCFFGLNTALCIIPFIGPICANLLSGKVIRMAEEADLPAILTAKMSANIAFDFLISLPPFIGALFEWMHKCNTRNVALLDTYLRQRAQDNMANGPPPRTDTLTHEPSQRVEMRFTDVPIQPQPMPAQAPVIQEPPSKSRGILPFSNPNKPKQGRSGPQEMGVV